MSFVTIAVIHLFILIPREDPEIARIHTVSHYRTSRRAIITGVRLGVAKHLASTGKIASRDTHTLDEYVLVRKCPAAASCVCCALWHMLASPQVRWRDHQRHRHDRDDHVRRRGRSWRRKFSSNASNSDEYHSPCLGIRRTILPGYGQRDP